MSIPSQSQSSPIIHFTSNGCSARNPSIESPLVSIDSDGEQHLSGLFERPQSTPKSSPILPPRSSKKSRNRDSTNENSLSLITNPKRRRITTVEESSLTNITPLNDINNRICDDEDESDERHCLRPPPLLVLSQSIQSKHPEQLIDTKLNHRFSLKKDLPHSPANYSFVFYHFNSIQLGEAKRLTRRMGNCFTSESIDLITTHIILPDDDPHLIITLDLILALIYGCRLVTFAWLKSSSHIGEWLREKKFEAKRFFLANPSLLIYRKLRRQLKPLDLFHQCGSIYLTSMVKQRSLLLKLVTLLGGDITVNRDRANIIIGQSSKSLSIVTYPQVNEQWIIDSIRTGKCLSFEKYFIDKVNGPS